MNRDEALTLLRSGYRARDEWNKRRSKEITAKLASGRADPVVDLHGAQLRDANLARFNLCFLELTGADLTGAYLQFATINHTSLESANLNSAILESASIVNCNLCGADLRKATLDGGHMHDVSASRARFDMADLRAAQIRRTDLAWADLSHSKLFGTSFSDCSADHTKFKGAYLAGTTFVEMDLRTSDIQCELNAHDLKISGPCTIDRSTLARSRGQLPGWFLSRCGLTPWEVAATRLFETDLTGLEVSEINNEIFEKRTKGVILVGGAFISYSRANDAFVDKLESSLCADGVNTWRDKHHMVAGPVERQLLDAIRLNDVVILVLSRESVRSDWVELELDRARRKEKQNERDVLLPVALDDDWKAKCEQPESAVLWRQVAKKNVIDFSNWDTSEKSYRDGYRKVIDGLRRYYGCDSTASDEDADGQRTP